MSTIRYGSSLGSSGVNGVKIPLRGHEDDNPEDDAADPNKIVQCPYDKNHQIRASRFPFHILKCAKNHPKLASELKTCPFNARHLIPKHELAHHIEHCEDKRSVVDDGELEPPRRFHVPVSTWTQPASEEDWEKEADDQAPTFVWGVSTNQLLQNNPEQRVVNNLTPGLRAPRTLPWKQPCEYPEGLEPGSLRWSDGF